MRIFRPHLVHANSTAALLAAALPARLRRTPILWHVRDFAPAGRLAVWCSRRAAGIIAVSRAVRAHLVRHGLDPRGIEVVYNGVDMAGVSGLSGRQRVQRHGALRARLGWPCEAFIYLNVGQYAPWKRQDVFLDAAARVARACDRARFLMVGGLPCGGDTAWRSHLERRIVARGLSGRVRMLGWQDAVDEVLGGSDVLVHTASREPFGRVLTEAMAVGVPVIAPRAGGAAEIIEDHVSGLLFEPDDLGALVAHMQRLQYPPDLGARLTEGGRVRVAERFTAKRTARSVRRIYARVLADSVHARRQRQTMRRIGEAQHGNAAEWLKGGC